VNPRMPYDAVRDFTPIAHLGNAPSIMLVPNNSPAKTVKEWVDYAKKNPGRLNYASSGNGTIVQLSAELFKAQADVFVVHIPYKGTALAIPDLISGKVDVLFDSLPTGMPHVRDGRLRALGVTTLKPTALAPGIPAIADVLPGYESNTWFGFLGPKNLPAEVVTRINTAANQVLKDPEVMDKLLRFGIEPVGGTPAQFTTMLASESAKWKKIITERKITLD
jgi:tripartite-type tricarboxylate transporter receptor subunit TctC